MAQVGGPEKDAVHAGNGGDGFHFGQGFGGARERGGFGEDAGDQHAEQLLLAREGFVLGAENLLFLQLEGLGHVPLAAHGGLLADVVGGDVGEVGLGDLEVVAEDRIVADFEGRNTGSLNFLLLQRGNPILTGGGRLAEFIQFRRVSGLDHAAVVDCQRGSDFKGAVNERDQLW